MCNCGLSVNMVVRVNFHYQLNLESPKRHDTRCSEVDLTREDTLETWVAPSMESKVNIISIRLSELSLPRCKQPHSPTPTTANAAIITPCATPRGHLSVLTLLVPK